MGDLLEKSKKIFNQLNVLELQKAGIEREDIKVTSHSHHIVTYPPLDALPEINPSNIYSLSNPKSSREIALYLHLPFCTGKCLYCAYITLPNQSKEFIDKYLDAVEKEIDLLLKYPNLQDVTINSIYIGGGTPTYLSTTQLNRVFELIKAKFNVKKNIEITIEGGPETLIDGDGKEKLELLLKNGVNRYSTGFQTFNDEILKLLKRRHNSQQAIDSYNLVKEMGFKNINIDLIPGLPDQTLEIWQNDLEQAGELEPASVTCYPLSIKQTAGIWPMFKNERQRFPSRENVIIMHIMANEFFNELNYTQRPVWWFTKTSKYVYKQQIHKWGDLGEQLALGVSGYSFLNGFQYFNFRNVQQYIEVVENNKLPICKQSERPATDI